jgi:hypothetical protein
MAVTGNSTMTFAFQDVRTIGLNASANIPCNNTVAITYGTGAGANQTQVLYQNIFTLSGTTQIVNLNTGSLSDSYGTPVVLTGVTGLQIQNKSTTNNLVVGAAGTDPWSGLFNTTGTVTLLPGDAIQVQTGVAGGWPVSGTSCELLFTGTSGQTFSIAFSGVGT